MPPWYVSFHSLSVVFPSEITLTTAYLLTPPAKTLPSHVAIIMDGNGRWASSRGRLRTAGHHQGSHTVRDIVRACRRAGVQALTLYAFSEQNWERAEHEVVALM